MHAVGVGARRACRSRRCRRTPATGRRPSGASTPSPTASTTPAYSEPGTNGSGGLNWYLFCTISRSGKLRLAARIATRTSPAFGSGVGSSFHCSASTPVGFSQSQACMVGSPRSVGGDRDDDTQRLRPRCRAATATAYNRFAMRILIANDDGYLAPGLAALVEACEGLGDIDVVAPEQNASGTSNSLTLQPPLYGLHRAPTAFATSTARRPTACTSRSPGLLEQRPDLVVSGINNGANMGDDTLYSGTVAAAMEGYLFGIPAIAFSQVREGLGRTSTPPARVARERRRAGAARTPPSGAPWLLNVNIPNRADADTLPRAITRLGPPPRQRAGDPPDQPARRDASTGSARPATRARRARAPTSTPPRSGQRVDHAAAGRPDRPRGAAGLARLSARAAR